MFNEFIEILDDYDNDGLSNYWYDEGIDEATEIINKFSNEDWENLMQIFPTKSTLWQERLINCIPVEDEEHKLRVLNETSKSDDLRLFECSVGALSNYDYDKIERADVIVNKINSLDVEDDPVSTMVFNRFLEKKKINKKDLKIFTDNIEKTAKDQISRLLELEAFKNSKIRIMPDVHAGKSCVIGFTGDLGDKVIPNIVGGDIGCGMLCVNLGQIDIDYNKLDNFINEAIPNGNEINSNKVSDFDLSKLLCYKSLKNTEMLENSLGSLGGGNHFIEIDDDQNGEKYLIIHSGSRNLGIQVAKYYQELANLICNYRILEYKDKQKELIDEYLSSGKKEDINQGLKELREEYSINQEKVPSEYAYLEGKYRDAYLHDMSICQDYAQLNRYIIAKKITDYMGWSLDNSFESVHNYISLEDNIVRKGAISAKEGETVIIPMNMRDGCLIGIGKGNADWNYSAPHGAGRIMSRSEAREKLKLEEYKNSMNNIFTTSVNEETLDEAPFVYKPADEIMKYITPTVEITNVIKPVYNFKSSHKFLRTEKDMLFNDENMNEEVVKSR